MSSQKDSPENLLTPRRRAVLRALADPPGRFSARALFDRLRAKGLRIGITTVYRALAALTNAGMVDTITDHTGQQLFSLRPVRGRGRYLACTRCGRSVIVDATPAHQWAAETAANHGFRDIHPLISLTGRCPECSSVDNVLDQL